MDLSLPLTEKEQEAVIGHCLQDFNFFLKCKKNLKKTWFTINPLIGVIFDQLNKIHERDGIFIQSINEFKQDFFFMELNAVERGKYYSLIDRCIYSANEFSSERLRKKLTGFIRTSLFKESIEGAAKRYSQSGLDDAYTWTKKKIEDLKDATFEENAHVMSFDDAATWVTEGEHRQQQAMSTGCKALDIALGGGLFRGETLGIMAPSNTGKTRCMITLARHLVKQKRRVLFFVHEGAPERIRETILCSYLCVSRQRLFAMIKNPELRELVNAVSKDLNNYLTFVPYIKTGGMYVEDVVAMAKDLNEEMINKTGKGYDVIMNDYPKKLKSRYATGSKEQQYRIVAADIYDQFNFLATELDCNCIVAVQTNRAGLKINSGRDASDTVLGMEEIDEAFGIAQNLANIITLNRSPEDKKLDIIRFNVAKSRNDSTDVVVNMRSCYRAALVFGDHNMIDNGGLWETEVPYGFCAAYDQQDNKRHKTETIHAALLNLEKVDGNVGTYNQQNSITAST